MLDLEPKCQGHSRNQNDPRHKKHATQKNLSMGSLSNWCDADTDSSKTIFGTHPMGGKNDTTSLTVNFFALKSKLRVFLRDEQ